MSEGASGLELQTPAQIDTAWEPLASRLGRIQDRLVSFKKAADESGVEGGGRYQRYYDDYRAETAAEVVSLKLAIEPLQAEWERRHGWQRYFLCVSDGGHVHYRNCHTLRWNSMIAWMPQLSGLDEAGMVEQVGFKACTHCFPSAPLHPAWVRTERAAAEKKVTDKLAKWEKGYAMRQKKVANARKRLERGQLKMARAAALFTGDERRWQEIEAESDIRYGSEDLKWAEKEVERWLAKKPG